MIIFHKIQPYLSTLLVLCLTLLVLNINYSESEPAKQSKYGEQTQEANTKQGSRPKLELDNIGLDKPTGLRTKKASLIWSKARKKYGDDNTVLLNSLLDELKSIDKKLLDLKQIKHENNDPYGDIENQLELKIHALLDKYELKGREGQEVPMSNRVQDHMIADDKLEKLYNKAKQLGFSSDELVELRNEIFHHKLKMAELDALVGDLKIAKEKVDIASNTINRNSNKNNQPDSGKVSELHKLVQSKEKEVAVAFNRLSLISDNPNVIKDTSFAQHRVLKLWSEVLRSNFTEEEKDSLKEELMHLEKKLNKMDKLNEESSLLEKHSQSFRPETEHLKEKYQLKHDAVRDKHQQLDKHVNKYFRDINSRIEENRQHTEL